MWRALGFWFYQFSLEGFRKAEKRLLEANSSNSLLLALGFSFICRMAYDEAGTLFVGFLWCIWSSSISLSLSLSVHFSSTLRMICDEVIWIFYAPNVLGHPKNYIPAICALVLHVSLFPRLALFISCFSFINPVNQFN